MVARYNEDVEWLHSVKYTVGGSIPWVVYNKGTSLHRGWVNLENVGREAGTYIYHIVNSWDWLEDTTIFCQGDPFPHSPNFLDRIGDSLGGFTGFGEEYICKLNGLPHHHLPGMPAAFQRFLGIQPEVVRFYPGACFAVGRERIKARPSHFWKELLRFTAREPDAPWILERMWLYLMGG